MKRFLPYLAFFLASPAYVVAQDVQTVAAKEEPKPVYSAKKTSFESGPFSVDKALKNMPSYEELQKERLIKSLTPDKPKHQEPGDGTYRVLGEPIDGSPVNFLGLPFSTSRRSSYAWGNAGIRWLWKKTTAVLVQTDEKK